MKKIFIYFWIIKLFLRYLLCLRLYKLINLVWNISNKTDSNMLFSKVYIILVIISLWVSIEGLYFFKDFGKLHFILNKFV